MNSLAKPLQIAWELVPFSFAEAKRGCSSCTLGWLKLENLISLFARRFSPKQRWGAESTRVGSSRRVPKRALS